MKPDRLAVLVALLLSAVASAHAATGSIARGLDAFDQREYREALREFTPLAQGGNAGAEYRLGIMYAMGLGVARDYAPAVAWLRKSAVQGNASAENDLGTLYDQGRGVAEDPAEAARWFLRAAMRGHGAAQLNLAQLYEAGRGVPRDPVRGFAWANAASELGEFRAQKVLDAIDRGMPPALAAQAEKLAAQYRREYVAPFRRD